MTIYMENVMKLLVIFLCVFSGACKKEHDRLIEPQNQQNTLEHNKEQLDPEGGQSDINPTELDNTVNEEPPKDKSPLAGFTKYTIAKGSQSSAQSAFKSVSVDSMVFDVLFDSTAIYTTQLRENQGDINKLYGFSDCSSFHHSNSARFGWRYHKKGLELFAYTYAGGKRSFVSMGSINVNQKYTCTIVAKKGKYVFYLNNSQETLMERGCNSGLQFRLYPYFGGNETAPHNMNIWIKDVR